MKKFKKWQMVRSGSSRRWRRNLRWYYEKMVDAMGLRKSGNLYLEPEDGATFKIDGTCCFFISRKKQEYNARLATLFELFTTKNNIIP